MTDDDKTPPTSPPQPISPPQPADQPTPPNPDQHRLLEQIYMIAATVRDVAVIAALIAVLVLGVRWPW